MERPTDAVIPWASLLSVTNPEPSCNELQATADGKHTDDIRAQKSQTSLRHVGNGLCRNDSISRIFLTAAAPDWSAGTSSEPLFRPESERRGCWFRQHASSSSLPVRCSSWLPPWSQSGSSARRVSDLSYSPGSVSLCPCWDEVREIESNYNTDIRLFHYLVISKSGIKTILIKFHLISRQILAELSGISSVL